VCSIDTVFEKRTGTCEEFMFFHIMQAFLSSACKQILIVMKAEISHIQHDSAVFSHHVQTRAGAGIRTE
jgi:hypothetical protein